MILTEQHRTGLKPILVPLCPPKLPLGLTRDRNQACMMTDRPLGPPGLLYDGCRLIFTGVMRPGRGIDHPPPSSAKVEERVQLHLNSPSGPSGEIYIRTDETNQGRYELPKYVSCPKVKEFFMLRFHKHSF